MSSGCVRVENPLELTSYLLKDSLNYNLEKITEILKTGETKNASIKTPIYVQRLHLLYLDPGLHFFVIRNRNTSVIVWFLLGFERFYKVF